VVLLQLAIKNHAAALSLLPPPQWDGAENQKERRKLMGWDGNGFTEWQREMKTTINNTEKKQIQHVVFSPPDAQLAPK